MKSILEIHAGRTSEQFLRDLVLAAEQAGVEADRAKMAEGLALFSFHFASKPVELRTTSLPGAAREVAFRFVDEDARGEIWETARDWYGVTGRVREFVDAIHAAFPIRAEGIDSDVRLGFRKAWLFLEKGYKSARFESLPGAPKALREIRGLLERYGLEHLSIIGVDPAHQTINLYPMLAPGWASQERVIALANELGFDEMDPAWLALVERSVAANFTFSLAPGSDARVERLSFYRPAMAEDELPDDEVLRKFALGAPIIAERRVFIPSIAYGRSVHYRKVEVDYDGGIVPVLIRAAQVPNETT